MAAVGAPLFGKPRDKGVGIGAAVLNGLAVGTVVAVGVGVAVAVADHVTFVRSHAVPTGLLVNVPLDVPLVGKVPATVLTKLDPVNMWFVIAIAGKVRARHVPVGSRLKITELPLEETLKVTVPPRVPPSVPV
jgi:hypothetical protein